jgi:hypothetical protein
MWENANVILVDYAFFDFQGRRKAFIHPGRGVGTTVHSGDRLIATTSYEPFNSSTFIRKEENK